MSASASQVWRHFDDTSFESVHRGTLDLLPQPSASVLDVGAGTGRDARALAARGFAVTAVEPSAVLRGEGRSRAGATVEWIADKLPQLGKLAARKFDFIIVSAVWMFVPAASRRAAMTRLSTLLAPNGTIVLSVRPKLRTDDPEMFTEVDQTDLTSSGAGAGLMLVRRLNEPDSLGRSIDWTTFVFKKQSTATETKQQPSSAVE